MNGMKKILLSLNEKPHVKTALPFVCIARSAECLPSPKTRPRRLALAGNNG